MDEMEIPVENNVENAGNVENADAANLQEEQERIQFTRSEFNNLADSYPEAGITSMAELVKKPYAKEMLSLWSRGVPLKDAYVLCNLEGITGAKAEQAKQEAINSMNTKSHLVPTSGGAAPEAMVPGDIMAQYREFFPEWNDRDIMEDYRKRK